MRESSSAEAETVLPVQDGTRSPGIPVFRRARHQGIGWLVLWGCLSSAVSFAQQVEPPSSPPDFNRDILPIFQEHCVGCHSSAAKMGGLVLESYEDLANGGEHGKAFLPGHSEQSRLVLMVEGKLEPRMPMNGQLEADQIVLLKSWIDASARPPDITESSSPLIPSAIPDIKPQVPVKPPVAGLGFHPNGQILAGGGFEEVHLMDPSDGRRTFSLPGPPDLVRSLVFSSDGALLAAGGGAPAQSGEIRIWDSTTRQLLHKLEGHSDSVYSLAFSPDGSTLASSSYDRKIKLWDVRSGEELRTLEEHNGPVFSIAFAPDGTWLASASGDGTVKVWSPPTGERLHTLSAAAGALYSVAVHPSGRELAVGGADKTIRIWVRIEEGWALDRSALAHRGTITRLLYSRDGRHLVSTATDRLVRVFEAKTLERVSQRAPEPEWVMSMALSPDNTRLALGCYDGAVKLVDGPVVADP